jgi:GDP-D-mannose dehydratase
VNEEYSLVIKNQLNSEISLVDCELPYAISSLYSQFNQMLPHQSFLICTIVSILFIIKKR